MTGTLLTSTFLYLYYYFLFFLQDLFLLAIYDFVSICQNCATVALSTELYVLFKRLCLALKTLCLDSVSLGCNGKMKLMLCQCLSKASKIIQSISFCCVVTHTIEVPRDSQFLYLALALYALASGLLEIRQLCGEESFAVTMLFWSACDAMPCIATMVAPLHDSKELEDADLLIFKSLVLTTPHPIELETEVYRLQKSHSGAMKEGLLSKKTMGSSRSFDPLGLESSFNSFRLQYLLEGIQKALRAGILDNRNNG